MFNFGSHQPIDEKFIRSQVTRLLRQPRDAASLIALAHRIYGWAPIGGGFDRSLGAYLTVTNAVMNASMPAGDKHLRSAAHATSSHLKSALAWAYTMRMPLDRKWLEQLTEQRKVRTRLIGRSVPDSAEQHLNTIESESIDLLVSSYSERITAVETLRSEYSKELVYPRMPKSTSLSDAIGEAIGIIQNRQRKVPTCVMRDGLLHSPGLCWVFREGEDLLGQLPSWFQTGIHMPIAIGSLAQFDQVKSTDMTFKSDPKQPVYLYNPGYPEKMRFTLHSDGQLAVDVAFGMYSLKKAYEEAGCDEHYELSWWTHLMRVIDLTTTEEVRRHQNLKAWPVEPARRDERQKYRDTIGEEFFQQFWVPLRRVIRTPNTSSAGTPGSGHKLTEENSRVRNLEGYVRPLKPGERASERARAAFRRDRGEDEVLGDNETYVRPHPHRYPDPFGESGSGVREARRRPRQTEE